MAAADAAPMAKPGADAFTDIVRLEGVHKYFGAVQALRDIDLAIGRNEIVGPDRRQRRRQVDADQGDDRRAAARPPGRIFVRDREIDLADYSVRMAHDLSIETVYQDKSLGEKQPLWRNFFVGRQITNRLGFIDIKAEKAIADDILTSAIGFRGVGITRRIRRCASSPAASARASPSAAPCTSTPT